MGNFLSVDAPAPESSWDYVKIYRATSEEGSYTEIVEQAIANLTYYDEDGTTTSWYKIKYYKSSDETYSSFSDPIQARANYYTTPKKVKKYLQLTNDFSDSTKPSLNTIMDWIFEAEDEVDGECKHAFRETTVTNEYHDYPYHFTYLWGFIPIYLNNRKIKTLDTDEGDKIELFDGSSWIDYVTEKTEGRNDDFWMDYNNGILYVRKGYMIIRRKAIRLTYRFGEDTIPNDIKKVATRMVVKEFYINEDRSNMLPEGESQNLSYSRKIELIDKQINIILNRHREFKGRVF